MCKYVADNPVGTIAIKDVATASCCVKSVYKLIYVVVIIPPPKPNNALIKPTLKPIREYSQ